MPDTQTIIEVREPEPHEATWECNFCHKQDARHVIELGYNKMASVHRFCDGCFLSLVTRAKVRVTEMDVRGWK